MAPAGKKKPKPKQPRKLSVEELMQAAEHSVTVSDPRHAVTLYTVAIQKADDNTALVSDLLEKRAEVYLSLQNQDAALQDYQSALEKAVTETDNGTTTTVDRLERKAALHMYIGQLSVSTDALASYQQGIECLRTAMAADTERKSEQQFKQQLATACCSISELYLTDLCYAENAEMKCESYLQQALQLVPESMDVWQILASLRFSQKRGLESIPFVLRVYAAMSTGCQALAALVGLRDNNDSNQRTSDEPQQQQQPQQGAATELLEVDQVQNLPGFEFRCQTAKLLLECAGTLQKEVSLSGTADDDNEKQQHQQQQQCAEAAIDVLGSLLAENDDVVEVWILLGDAFCFLDEQRLQQSSFQCWERALEMLTALHESLEQEQADDMDHDDDDDDDELQQHLDEVVCQMQDLRAKLEEARSAVSAQMTE